MTMKYYITGILDLDHFTDCYRLIDCYFRDEAHDRDLKSYYDLIFYYGRVDIDPALLGQKLVATMEKRGDRFDFLNDPLLSLETVEDFRSHYVAPDFQKRISLQNRFEGTSLYPDTEGDGELPFSDPDDISVDIPFD